MTVGIAVTTTESERPLDETDSTARSLFPRRPRPPRMSDFDLDLRAVEEAADFEGADDDGDRRIVLGVLDGTTPAAEWAAAVEAGRVLVLAVEGDLNDLAAGFARDVLELDGNMVHFRGFLLVTPPGVTVDSSRLSR